MSNINRKTGVFGEDGNYPTECWHWGGKAKPDKYGYMRCQRNGKTRYRHRIEYEKVNGPIPPGLVIDHLCRNRQCLRPDHMEPVTISENVKRGKRDRKTCKNGHEWKEGSYREYDKVVRGKIYIERVCIQCNKDRCRRHRMKHLKG